MRLRHRGRVFVNRSMTSQVEYLDRIETLSADKLAQLQWRKLKTVISYAYQNLPFYRRRFSDAGITPASIKSPADLARIPMVTKADIINETIAGADYRVGIEALFGRQPDNVVMTSGTQGFHTFAAIGGYELSRGAIRAVQREFWMQKMRPGMRVVALCPGWHFLSLLDCKAMGRLGVSCVLPWGTHIPRFTKSFLDAVRTLRPDYLLTMPPMLYAMLRECERVQVDPRRVFASVRYVSAVGEPVTAGLRSRLREQLALEDFFERGGSSDGLWGGGECSFHRGHHVFADYFYIEIVDPETGRQLPAGERGAVVVTNLTLGKSLYVRFNCEDLGMILPGGCPCGRTHPRVELFDRLSNVLILDKRSITTYDIRCCLDEIPETCGIPFFVIKQSDGRARIELYHPSPEASMDLDRVGRMLAERLEVQFPIQIIRTMPARWKGRIIDERAQTAAERYPRA
jgi:phenylacetate-CoA ligase